MADSMEVQRHTPLQTPAPSASPLAPIAWTPVPSGLAPAPSPLPPATLEHTATPSAPSPALFSPSSLQQQDPLSSPHSGLLSERNLWRGLPRFGTRANRGETQAPLGTPANEGSQVPSGTPVSRGAFQGLSRAPLARYWGLGMGLEHKGGVSSGHKQQRQWDVGAGAEACGPSHGIGALPRSKEGLSQGVQAGVPGVGGGQRQMESDGGGGYDSMDVCQGGRASRRVTAGITAGLTAGTRAWISRLRSEGSASASATSELAEPMKHSPHSAAGETHEQILPTETQKAHPHTPHPEEPTHHLQDPRTHEQILPTETQKAHPHTPYPVEPTHHLQDPRTVGQGHSLHAAERPMEVRATNRVRYTEQASVWRSDGFLSRDRQEASGDSMQCMEGGTHRGLGGGRKEGRGGGGSGFQNLGKAEGEGQGVEEEEEGEGWPGPVRRASGTFLETHRVDLGHLGPHSQRGKTQGHPSQGGPEGAGVEDSGSGRGRGRRRSFSDAVGILGTAVAASPKGHKRLQHLPASSPWGGIPEDDPPSAPDTHHPVPDPHASLQGKGMRPMEGAGGGPTVSSQAREAHGAAKPDAVVDVAALIARAPAYPVLGTPPVSPWGFPSPNETANPLCAPQGSPPLVPALARALSVGVAGGLPQVPSVDAIDAAAAAAANLVISQQQAWTSHFLQQSEVSHYLLQQGPGQGSRREGLRRSFERWRRDISGTPELEEATGSAPLDNVTIANTALDHVTIANSTPDHVTIPNTTLDHVTVASTSLPCQGTLGLPADASGVPSNPAGTPRAVLGPGALSPGPGAEQGKRVPVFSRLRGHMWDPQYAQAHLRYAGAEPQGTSRRQTLDQGGRVVSLEEVMSGVAVAPAGTPGLKGQGAPIEGLKMGSFRFLLGGKEGASFPPLAQPVVYPGVHDSGDRVAAGQTGEAGEFFDIEAHRARKGKGETRAV